MSAPDRSPLLTKREAAAYLRQSIRSFERHVLKYLPHVRIGGRFFYTRDDLDAWIASHRVAPDPPSAHARMLLRAREILEQIRKPRR